VARAPDDTHPQEQSGFKQDQPQAQSSAGPASLGSSGRADTTPHDAPSLLSPSSSLSSPVPDQDSPADALSRIIEASRSLAGSNQGMAKQLAELDVRFSNLTAERDYLAEEAAQLKASLLSAMRELKRLNGRNAGQEQDLTSTRQQLLETRRIAMLKEEQGQEEAKAVLTPELHAEHEQVEKLQKTHKQDIATAAGLAKKLALAEQAVDEMSHERDTLRKQLDMQLIAFRRESDHLKARVEQYIQIAEMAKKQAHQRVEDIGTEYLRRETELILRIRQLEQESDAAKQQARALELRNHELRTRVLSRVQEALGAEGASAPVTPAALGAHDFGSQRVQRAQDDSVPPVQPHPDQTAAPMHHVSFVPSLAPYTPRRFWHPRHQAPQGHDGTHPAMHAQQGASRQSSAPVRHPDGFPRPAHMSSGLAEQHPVDRAASHQSAQPPAHVPSEPHPQVTLSSTGQLVGMENRDELTLQEIRAPNLRPTEQDMEQELVGMMRAARQHGESKEGFKQSVLSSGYPEALVEKVWR